MGERVLFFNVLILLSKQVSILLVECLVEFIKVLIMILSNVRLDALYLSVNQQFGLLIILISDKAVNTEFLDKHGGLKEQQAHLFGCDFLYSCFNPRNLVQVVLKDIAPVEELHLIQDKDFGDLLNVVKDGKLEEELLFFDFFTSLFNSLGLDSSDS